MNQSIMAACLAGIGVLIAGCQTSQTGPMAVSASDEACLNLATGPADYVPPFPDDCTALSETASGVKYVPITEGDQGGRSPSLDDTIMVHYEAFLAEQGTLIDSSYLRGAASIYDMSDLIDGWAEALQLMSPGDEWLVFVPSVEAFGSNPVGDLIPPNADIVYRVRLDEFVTGSAPAEPPAPEISAVHTMSPDGIVEPLGPDMAAWQAYFPWDHSRDGVKALPSGVSFIVLEYGPGDTQTAQESDRVRIHYEGRLAESGEFFDSSWSGGGPAQFTVGELIPGMTDALTQMRPGDRFLVHVPAALAYGETGAGEAVPPDADLMFQIALLQIEAAE